MPRKRKFNERIKEELSELGKTRGNLEDFESNFLGNYSEKCNLIHYQLKNKIPKELFDTSCNQYIISLISCLETFFRDISVFCLNLDKDLRNELINDLKINNQNLKGLSSLEVSEFLTKCLNFQNFEDVNYIFSKILKKDFLNEFEHFIIRKCAIGGNIVNNLSLKKIYSKWKELLFGSIEKRHKIIHDGNFKEKTNIQEIKKIEFFVLIIPQMITYWFSKKIKMKYIVLEFSKEEKIPMFFSVEDVLSDKWELCREGDIGIRFFNH